MNFQRKYIKIYSGLKRWLIWLLIEEKEKIWILSNYIVRSSAMNNIMKEINKKYPITKKLMIEKIIQENKNSYENCRNKYLNNLNMIKNNNDIII